MTRRRWLGRAAAGSLALALPGRLRAGGPSESKTKAMEKNAGLIYIFAILNNGQGRDVGIFSIDPETDTWTRLIERQNDGGGFFNINEARVSPDGATIAFTRFGMMGEGDGVWGVDTFGGEPRRLHRVSGSFQGRLLWSGDGKEMIVSRIDFNTPDEADQLGVWRVDLASGEKTKLPIPEADTLLDWSPDGRLLLVASARKSKDESARTNPFDQSRPVYLLRLDGRVERLITPGGGQTSNHRFAPDGRRVSYTQTTGDESCIWTVDLDGGQRRCVLSEREFSAPSQAAWSPDGRRLAASCLLRPRNDKGDSVGGNGDNQLEIADADGRHRRQVQLPAMSFIRLLDWR